VPAPSLPPFGMRTPVPIRDPPSWFLTTSAVFSSMTLRPLQIAADPGVHRVSFRCETEFPAMLLLPFEAFPPPTAWDPETNLRFPGRVTEATVSGRPVHRVPCPLALCPLSDTALSRRASRSRGLEALLHRRVRCLPGRCQPNLPGAPLGLSDLPTSRIARFLPSPRAAKGARGDHVRGPSA
jgi:hypothetical protein